jgi:hypothetical protein
MMEEFKVYKKGKYYYVSYEICDPLSPTPYSSKEEVEKGAKLFLDWANNLNIK